MTSRDNPPTPATPRRFPAGADLAGVAVVLLASFLFLAPRAAADSADPAPVLVELFTSQGCSSCPPADRLLTRLVEEDRVIALAFHVDYWNYIGWTDPFSSKAWSDRQRGYAAIFGSNRIYTPQLVVNGRWEGVGSDAREVDRLLRDARGSLRDELGLEIEESAAGLTARLSVTEPVGARRAWLAVAESGFETPVGRGENAHHTLRNDNVVRRLEAVELGEDVPVELDPEWKRDRLRLVAFLQDPKTLAVTAATQAGLP